MSEKKNPQGSHQHSFEDLLKEVKEAYKGIAKSFGKMKKEDELKPLGLDPNREIES
jgi:predicted RNA-binding protein with PIN domain